MSRRTIKKATRIINKSQFLRAEESDSDDAPEINYHEKMCTKRTDPTKRKTKHPVRFNDSSDTQSEEETKIYYLVKNMSPFDGRFSVVTGIKQISSNHFDSSLAVVSEKAFIIYIRTVNVRKMKFYSPF